jgi:hypothetical protein
LSQDISKTLNFNCNDNVLKKRNIPKTLLLCAHLMQWVSNITKGKGKPFFFFSITDPRGIPKTDLHTKKSKHMVPIKRKNILTWQTFTPLKSYPKHAPPALWIYKYKVEKSCSLSSNSPHSSRVQFTKFCMTITYDFF